MAEPTKSDLAVVVASALVPVVVLLWGMQPGNPYGYYVFLRFVVCAGAFVYCALFAGKRGTLVIVFVVVAVMYNPFIPVHLTRGKWFPINVATISVFAAGLAFWFIDFRRERRVHKAAAVAWSKLMDKKES